LKLDVKGVLFDPDETLLDTTRAHKKACKQVAKLITTLPPAKKRGFLPRDLEVLLVEFVDRELKNLAYDRSSWWVNFILELGFNATPGFIRSLTETYWKTFVGESRLFPDALSTLHYLKKKGHRLGIVADTDGISLLKKNRIKICGLDRFLDVIVIAGESGTMIRPRPLSLLLAAKKLNLNPRQCIFVGDKPFTDIQGAKAAGMTTVLVQRRMWNLSPVPNHLIRSLSELKNLL
jgi:putative hydrolase of the HAD superfamily